MCLVADKNIKTNPNENHIDKTSNQTDSVNVYIYLSSIFLLNMCMLIFKLI